MPPPPPLHARGASENPANRVEKTHLGPGEELDPEEEVSSRRTIFLADDSQSIIAWNNSPDVGFDAGINPYRGCEHGCAYCFARPTHEYLDFSLGLDFETKILVKL